MGTWTNAPQVSKPPSIPQGRPLDQTAVLQQLVAYSKELAQALTIMKNDLEFMINGHLDANNIRAKSITADRMDVNELSAISANLGHITAGLIEAVTIIGSLIRTTGTYPRCEMSATDNLFSAYADADNYIAITPDLSGIPSVIHIRNGFVWGKDDSSALGHRKFAVTNLILEAIGLIDSLPGSYHRFPNWSAIYNKDQSKTLQQDLNSIASSLSGLSSNISGLWSAVNGLDARVTALGG
jgi:hypothetical protein